MSDPIFTLLINAGGQSERMGQPKALLPVPPHGRPLLHHVIERLQPLVDGATVVIANDIDQLTATPLPAGVQIIPDREAGLGPLGGMVSGMAHVAQWAIMVACDMPLLNPALFAWMQKVAVEGVGGKRWDALVPRVGGHPEPLHALYHRRCLATMKHSLALGARRADSFLPLVRTRFLAESDLREYDPELRSFTNVNTPQEWAAATALLTAKE